MVAMGLEAECTVRVGRKTSTGRALLEGETLIFRGEFDLQIPFASMREVSVDGVALVVKTHDQEARLEVGAPVAERWMRLIKEPKGLLEKLEVGPHLRVAAVDVRDSLFLTALRERTAGVAEGRVPEGVPVVFFGAETRDALRKIQLLRARMMDTGILWIIRPKGSPAIGESDVYEAARGAGLVDTKVVAFSKTHTAHKCVIPVDQRGVMRRRPPVVTIPPSAPLLQPKKGGGARTRSSASKPPPRPAARPPTPTRPASASKATKPARSTRPGKPAARPAGKKHK